MAILSLGDPLNSNVASICKAHKNDAHFFFSIVRSKMDFRYLKYASPKVLRKKTLIGELSSLLKEDTEELYRFSREVPRCIKRYKRILFPLIKRQPWEFADFSTKNRNNPKLVEKFIFLNHSILLFMGNELKNDLEFITNVIIKNPWLIQYIPEHFKDNPDLVRLALRVNPEVYTVIPAKFQEDARFLKNIFAKKTPQYNQLLELVRRKRENELEVSGYILRFSPDRKKFSLVHPGTTAEIAKSRLSPIEAIA